MRPLALLAAALLAAPAAQAQDSARFQSLDRNGDGFLALEEVRHIANYERAFKEADDNRDRRLDPTEFVKAESLHWRHIGTAYLNDGALTAMVKGALLRENGIKSTDIRVDSNKGIVYLSGWVDTDAQRAKAARVASLVDGVREVRNGIAVR